MDRDFLKETRSLTVEDIAGPILVLAPHADDESLGCGGLIAALCDSEVPVHVWLISDGTMSHPNSVAFPSDHRRAIREAEFSRACMILGVPAERLQFFRFPDTRVPAPDAGNFGQATEQIKAQLRTLKPKTIFTPWRRDPHCDHQGTTALIRAAISQLQWSGTLYEYPIWLYELATEGDAPHPDEVEVFVFDVNEEFLVKKKKAIETHASQLGQIIHDDPDAFCLQPQVLAHFLTPIEYYYHTHEERIFTARVL